MQKMLNKDFWETQLVRFVVCVVKRSAGGHAMNAPPTGSLVQELLKPVNCELECLLALKSLLFPCRFIVNTLLTGRLHILSAAQVSGEEFFCKFYTFSVRKQIIWRQKRRISFKPSRIRVQQTSNPGINETFGFPLARPFSHPQWCCGISRPWILRCGCGGWPRRGSCWRPPSWF